VVTKHSAEAKNYHKINIHLILICTGTVDSITSQLFRKRQNMLFSMHSTILLQIANKEKKNSIVICRDALPLASGGAMCTAVWSITPYQQAKY
jgi:hypothetical protein